jgi:integrase
MKTPAPAPRAASKRAIALSPTKVQFLYRHRNGRYYVRTFADSKEKWSSLKTTLLSVARNRMKEHLDAAERQKLTGGAPEASGTLAFGGALEAYRERLHVADLRPNTKEYREAGIKLVLRSWEGIEALNVRRITSAMVESWLRRFKANAVPYVPCGAKTPARNSTGASVTTIKCALDAVRHVLDVAVGAGHLYANPARNVALTNVARGMFKSARREKAERGSSRPPTREEFLCLVDAVQNAGVANCKAAADYVRFIAYCGARKNEAAHVLWSDVDFTDEIIRLRVTKNGEERSVPMTGEMNVLLLRMRERNHATALENAVLLVKDAQGFITSACRRLGIPRFTPHSLRHLFGTACLESGVDVRTVAKWLGHKDNGALLLKVYAHVRRKHESEMIRRVSFASSGSMSSKQDTTPSG